MARALPTDLEPVRLLPHGGAEPGGLLTFEDTARLDEGAPCGDVVAGRLQPTTQPRWNDGEVVARACMLLGRHTQKTERWSLSVGCGGKLTRNPDTLRVATIGVVRSQRRPDDCAGSEWLDGAPDLAIEVCSDARRWPEHVAKAMDFLAAGGRMVWLLIPATKRVLVLRPHSNVELLSENDQLDAGTRWKVSAAACGNSSADGSPRVAVAFASALPAPRTSTSQASS